MCIFQGPAHVSSTKILAAALTDGRQFTVYSNTIVLEEKKADSSPKRAKDNDGEASPSPRPTPAMILPFPAGPVEFVNLEGYAEIFGDLYGSTHFLTKGKGKGSAATVHDVGSYRVSVAETVGDLGRIDAEFVLDGAVRQLMAERYAQGFSFLVCRLREGAKYHPLGYVHRQRAADGGLFVPTYHFHGHADGAVDWDHVIYTNGTIDGLPPTCLEHTRSRRVDADDTRCGLRRDGIGAALYDLLRDFTGSCCYQIGPEHHVANRDLVVRI